MTYVFETITIGVLRGIRQQGGGRSVSHLRVLQVIDGGWTYAGTAELSDELSADTAGRRDGRVDVAGRAKVGQPGRQARARAAKRTHEETAMAANLRLPSETALTSAVRSAQMVPPVPTRNAVSVSCAEAALRRRRARERTRRTERSILDVGTLDNLSRGQQEGRADSEVRVRRVGSLSGCKGGVGRGARGRAEGDQRAGRRARQAAQGQFSGYLPSARTGTD